MPKTEMSPFRIGAFGLLLIVFGITVYEFSTAIWDSKLPTEATLLLPIIFVVIGVSLVAYAIYKWLTK